MNEIVAVVFPKLTVTKLITGLLDIWEPVDGCVKEIVKLLDVTFDEAKFIGAFDEDPVFLLFLNVP